MLTQSFRGARFATLAAVLLVSSCGYIADKDRIKIAMFDGKPVTRGDFDKVLREMSAKERPLIRTKGDMLKAVQDYLDQRVREKNAEELVAANKLHVQRELAEAVLRINEPEVFFKIENPEDYKMNEADVMYLEKERDYRIDEMVKKLEAEQGVYYRIEEAVAGDTIAISDEEYADEYEIRKPQLMHPERVAFTGVLIPGDSSEIRSKSTEIAKKLREGSAPRDFVGGASAIPGAVLIEAELENDPANLKFAPFWQQAAGAQVNAVIGPIFVRGWTEATEDAQGNVTQRPYPNGMLVCVVTDRTDQTQKTLEESKPELQRNVLYAKVMQQLRQENGVEIFEDKLADPGMYGNQQ